MLKPANKKELRKIIENRIQTEGHKCNLNDIDVSNITDMSDLFNGSEFNGKFSILDDNARALSSFNGDISEWDVSNVTNMRSMFTHSRFNGDISKWDVSNVTNMSCMFLFSHFNGDISKWDVSNVTNMSCMFLFSHFNGDISEWDVSNVTDMSCMFSSSKFNGDISEWDVSKVTNMSCMFSSNKFNGDISEWDVSEEISKQDRWIRCNYLKKQFLTTTLNKKEILRNLIDERIKRFGSECDLNDIDVSGLTDMSELFKGSKFNGDISKWDVSNVTNMSGIFWESNFDGDISRWDVSSVTNMDGMFWKSNFNGDISEWDVSNVTDMHKMFSHSQFNGDISSWNVSNVTNMSSMFAYSKFTGDIAGWNVSRRTNKEGMFFESELLAMFENRQKFNAFEGSSFKDDTNDDIFGVDYEDKKNKVIASWMKSKDVAPSSESESRKNFRLRLDSVIKSYEELCKRRDAQAKSEADVNAADKEILAESANQQNHNAFEGNDFNGDISDEVSGIVDENEKKDDDVAPPTAC